MTQQDLKVILMVEEDLQHATLACKACRKISGHYEMVHVFTGNEALDYLHCQGNYKDRDRNKEPSLILLSLAKPEHSALHILKEIRTHKKTKALPIVLFCTSPHEMYMAKAYEHGANSYLEKPRTFNEFVETIQGLTEYWFNLVTPPPVHKCP
jgi:two-component system, response regulator